MARDDDDLTATTDLRNTAKDIDEVSTITDYTEKIISLKEKNKAMQSTAAQQAFRIQELEAALALASQTPISY